MLARWPIWYKLLAGVFALAFIVLALGISSFRGVYAYRQVVRSISQRATELPLASELASDVSDLRVTLSQTRRASDLSPPGTRPRVDMQILREEFRANLLSVGESLRRYRAQLEQNDLAEDDEFDNREEWETVRKFERSLAMIDSLHSNEDWMLDEVRIDALNEELEELHRLSAEIPSFLQRRMHELAGDVKVRYRTLIAINWSTLLVAVTIMSGLTLAFYWRVVKPLRGLIKGSRRVAGGEFNHRIEVPSRDELAELAAAMNDMTARFREIRDDLDRKVQLRTRQVVRSEQLASVGFLAAGVAHEINNPLASIAWCAESLETRLSEQEELGEGAEAAPLGEAEEERAELFRVLRHYLHMIQTEAFRCKGITEKLLDFSRMGNVEKHSIDLRELVQGVLDMISHLGKYRDRHVAFEAGAPVHARINPQEIKQVVLNLVTNGLDALQPGGTVTLRLAEHDGRAHLIVADDGCGMSEEVLEHLFEPFFTRRQNGQGTGLGLSISYRIVEDHGGAIEAHSDGPGRGSRFDLTLPLAGHDQETTQEQAA